MTLENDKDDLSPLESSALPEGPGTDDEGQVNDKALDEIPVVERDESGYYVDESGRVIEEGADSNGKKKKRRYFKRRFIFRFLDKIGCGFLARFPERWPRIFWFLIGVVLPLWSLILVAAISGWGLAKLESPIEIDSNNNKLQTKYRAARINNSTRAIVASAPVLCLDLFFANNSELQSVQDILTSLSIENEEDYFRVATRLDEIATADFDFRITSAVRNRSGLVNFMTKCGSQINEAVSNVTIFTDAFFSGDDSLNFNWNRCANDSFAYQFVVDVPFIGRQVYEAYHPEAQAAFFENTWLENMMSINQSLYEQNLPQDPSAEDIQRVKFMSFLKATELATGADGCKVNTPAGAWFFFTIMTTVGYGNQSPESQAGQAMLYTIGFASILLFAAVATGAGYIMTNLFDDIAEKQKLGCLSRPFFATCFWGMLYYLWLLLIGSYTADWKRTRLGMNEFGLEEGYWFAYVSTTTIGLGDIYLEPEVLVSQDLLIFSLLFLIGFVLLTSFLGKLGSYIIGLEHVGGKTFEQALRDTRVCCGHRVVRAGIDLGYSTVSVGQAVVESGQKVLRKGFNVPQKAVAETNQVDEKPESVASHDDLDISNADGEPIVTC